MKHTLQITFIIVAIFLFTQIIGLYTVNNYIQVSTDSSGNTIVLYQNTTMGEPASLPESERNWSFLVIIISILVMTGLLLLMIKFGMGKLWRYGFFLAVVFSLAVAFGVYTQMLALSKWVAIIAAILLAFFKVFKPNVYVHNITEMFLYAGIAIMVLPLLNIYSAIGLLIVVSIYDMYAVWKSKHMITLAKFQSENKAFAGLAIPYMRPGKTIKKEIKVVAHKKVKPKKITAEEKEDMKPKTAILGGGDIGFTLIFASVVMEMLITSMGVAKAAAFFYSLIIVLCATIALGLLFAFSKKDRFYPAMPFISAGCLIGYLIVILII